MYTLMALPSSRFGTASIRRSCSYQASRRSLLLKTGCDRSELGFEPDEEFGAVECASFAGVIRDRLDVLGIGRGAAEHAFETIIADQVERNQRWARGEHFPLDPDMAGELRKEESTLQELDLSRWQDQVRDRVAAGDSLSDRMAPG